MKRKTVALIALLSGIVIAGAVVRQKASPSAAGTEAAAATVKKADYTDGWRAVDSLADIGLTESALNIVEEIYQKAKASAVPAQQVKTLMYRLRLESYKEEQSIVKAIHRLDSDMAEAPEPLQSILHSIAAEVYWRYYEQNRWRFHDRTAAVNFKQDDISTWDLAGIVGATLEQYELSLRNAALLKKYRLDEFADILCKARENTGRRPTLFDFLAHRAVDFFMNTETGLPQPAQVFQLDKKEYLGRGNDFARFTITTKDSLSLAFRGLKLLQELISFHTADNNTDALIDVDLKRLRFVHSGAVIEEKDSLYQAALEGLFRKHRASPAATEILYDNALLFVEQGKNFKPGTAEQYKWSNKKAMDLCTTAREIFPESYGGCRCADLKNELLAKSLSLEVEEVSLPSKPSRALLKWKNVEKVWFRAVPMDHAEFNELLEKYYEQEKLISRLRGLKPSAEWTVQLPDDGDYQLHAAEIRVPPLEHGFYVIIASADADFSYPKNGIAVAHFWVSRISYFGRMPEDGTCEFYVRDRESGSPCANAMVKKLERVYNDVERQYDLVEKGKFTTDGEGRVVLPSPFLPNIFNSQPFCIEILCGKDRLASERTYYQYKSDYTERPRLKTFFFTDRSIYRPGQTVYFKGIILWREGDSSSIVPRRKSTVELYDVNNQKVSSLVLTTNEYGTMSGSFIAPSGVLNGRMHIQDQWGSAYFSVEEYKRPKFDVTVLPVKGQFRLGEQIMVIGRALAYAGSPIDGARVKYRVVRSTQYPYWYGWWCFWCPPSPDMEITSGSTATNDTGGFSVAFTAIPDRGVDKSYNPTFTYTVSADVTDMGGETRSGQSEVSVGYCALNLSIDIPREIDKNRDTVFSVKATNMSGETEPAKGTMRIFRLRGPDNPLRNRLWDKPDKFIIDKKTSTADFPGLPYSDEDLVVNWPKEKKVFEKAFDTKTDSMLTLAKELRDWPQGIYALEAVSKDAFNQDVKITRYFTVYSKNENTVPVQQCDWFAAVRGSGEPGDTAAFLIGSAEKDVRVLYEVEHGNKIVKKEWLSLSKSQKLVRIPILEKHRGNFSVHFTFIKNNRKYQHNATVSVPWTNKELAFTFATFRNKLLPGEKEEWRITITGKKSGKAAAEMAASMYDASLDAFAGHSWFFDINPYHRCALGWDMNSQFASAGSQLYSENWNSSNSCPSMEYPYLNWFGYEAGYYYSGYGGPHRGAKAISMMKSRAEPMGIGYAESMPSPASPSELKEKSSSFGNAGFADGIDALLSSNPRGESGAVGIDDEKADKKAASRQDLSSVKARANLNETAFFFPHLTTNEKGEVVVSFTVPEALTKWKMLGFAHTKDLKYGLVTKELVTQKPLMVMPNLPRFLREADRITLMTKIINLSDSALAGSAQLMLFDATTMRPVDTVFGNVNSIKNIAVRKGLSTAVGWEISVPEGVPAVMVRIVAKAGDFSDGEENTLPVLTNRMLVTETLCLPMRGKGTKKFTFEKLAKQASQDGGSTTLRSHKLTLEFTQNPAWYAVQALPYLMEYPYECAEQTFARFYANTLATGIARSTPKIKAVFDSWKRSSPDALLSNLEKNQELKSALLEETPWVLDGKNESESKNRIALLFDLNRMSHELGAAQRKLETMQRSNGGWPWFEGMPDDRFITQYIITGFGRLQNITMISTDDGAIKNMVAQGQRYLDNRIREDYEEVMAHAQWPDSNHLGCLQIQYLYARSYFKDIPVPEQNKKAFDYYKNQAVKYWLRNSRYLQGMIALALNRYGAKDLPRHIIRSLKENSLSSEEMGMYWKEGYEGSHWYEAPVEAQALAIEAFDEVAHDTASVEAMKVWLLKSKQTQNWKTTKATAEACYALLLRGADLLAAGNDVTVTLGPITVDPKKMANGNVEAGTGYFKTSWNKGEITPAMGNVTITKGSSGVAWGALYWQYFEQLDKITPAATPLKLGKRLFIKRTSDRGPVLDPVTEKAIVKIGDRITVRIELRVDRDMEYVHLKDMRAAGFEPLKVLSGYRWQDGLGYYECTRDAATSFFISYLAKGTYIFEYDLVATHRGDFSNGISSVQCMYAPEFASHSEGIRVTVKE
jgi:uncharacterized protein YfaS (alpha-2-macroglobulin family)